MGFMRSTDDRTDLMNNLARNIRDPRGRLVGCYFPATRIIRTQDGELWRVDEANQVRSGDRSVGQLDSEQKVLILAAAGSH